MSAIFANLDVPFSLAVELVTQADFDAAGLTDWLTDDEQVRFEELKVHAVAKRGLQWLLGRYAAKLACRRWMEEQGMPITEWNNIQVDNDSNGMPRLTISGMTDLPNLSIAHSGHEAIAAVSAHAVPVGVDIESHIPQMHAAALAKRVSSTTEYQRWFLNITEEVLSERLLYFWVAKEATSKCVGSGLQWQTKAFQIIDMHMTQLSVEFNGSVYSVYLDDASYNGACAVAFQRV